MPQIKSMNRREFMRNSSLSAAGVVALSNGDKVLWASEPGSAAVAPSDTLRVGVIGIGARVQQDAYSFSITPGVTLVAAADVYKDRLTRAKELFGEQLETTNDYRRLLDRKDIDAVLIGTPDHWHKRLIIEAMDAGKDVYCEKPMTYKIEEGFEIIDAEKRTGRILQIGSQWVNSPLTLLARKWIDEGRCGDITLVKAWENRNTPSGAWFYPIAPDGNEQTIDWKQWLGSAPEVPFDARRYFRWRCYWDYSGGLQTDLVVHHLNTLHYLMHETAPRSSMTYGGSYRWKKVHPEAEVPDVVQTLFEYPNFTYNVSLTLNSSTQGFGAFFMGTKGTIQISETELAFFPDHPLDDFGWVVAAWPARMQDDFCKEQNIVGINSPWAPGSCTAPESIEHYNVLGDPTDLHVRAFVECVRTRTRSKESAVEGHNAALGAHIANMSYRAGSRKVLWDGQKATVA
ncbi:MAG TPA: Gfo/Idh/MocA family oxidoreductase [Terriglobia bacterium]|nr:Gfo/Idh/MocA family oxidoreductase [Terriglobia bacterium]